MAFEIEQREARRLLDGIELGSMPTADVARLIELADPVWVYLVFTWLRTRYAKHAAASGVIGRIVEISQRYPIVARMMKEGQPDSLVEWFESTYEYRELDADAFVQIVIEKFES